MYDSVHDFIHYLCLIIYAFIADEVPFVSVALQLSNPYSTLR